MILLGIETSCDETSAALYEAQGDFRGKLLSNIVASQMDLHARFGGIVPELSARAHIERLPAVTSQALDQAGLGFQDIDAVAVTHRPGLLSALLCGVAYARGAASALRRPLFAVDHIKAHVAAAFLPAPPGTSSETSPVTATDLPALALVASGGHTLLLKMKSPLEFELLGTTRDDAVGEAFDKVGQLLGLPFPGGPHVERAARGGDPNAFRFPVGVIRGAPLDFSFSGLKTSVLYATAKMSPKIRKARTADIAASFQSAAIHALTGRAVAAVRQTDLKTFILCGGVAANRTLRELLARALSAEGAELHVPPVMFCGDTAAQVAVFGSFMSAGGAKNSCEEIDAETTSELFLNSHVA